MNPFWSSFKDLCSYDVGEVTVKSNSWLKLKDLKFFLICFSVPKGLSVAIEIRIEILENRPECNSDYSCGSKSVL